MKSQEGGIRLRSAAGTDRKVQAARAVSYLEFLLRTLTHPEPTPSRGSRPETGLFSTTFGRV
jgi:hypothetical protein